MFVCDIDLKKDDRMIQGFARLPAEVQKVVMDTPRWNWNGVQLLGFNNDDLCIWTMDGEMIEPDGDGANASFVLESISVMSMGEYQIRK